MISFQQFRDKYNNKPIDWDGFYGAQCMDLMHFYIVEVLGLTGNILAAPTAYQAYLNGDSHFEKIPNTPTGVPQNGDIVFWNTTIGSAGHVAVFIDGDVNRFNSFDQNFPTGSVSHIQSHDYNGVVGWLRFKQPTDLQAELNKVRAERDKNWQLYQAELTKNKELTTLFTTTKDQLTTANQTITTLQTKIKNALTALS